MRHQEVKPCTPRYTVNEEETSSYNKDSPTSSVDLDLGPILPPKQKCKEASLTSIYQQGDHKTSSHPEALEWTQKTLGNLKDVNFFPLRIPHLLFQENLE